MRIVDLFSGVGGLTFGFWYKQLNGNFIRNNKWDIIFANEFDTAAAHAFSLNYPTINMINDDIHNLTTEKIQKLIGNEEIDLIIGGPPCQSYSYVGKRKYDDKAKLYNEYYRILSIIQPRMFLFENVKGILSMKNEKGNLVINDIEATFAKINDTPGYKISYQTLDAVNYGVPQHRERVFIIGIRDDLNIAWSFANLIKEDTILTLQDAISDLPAVNPGDNIQHYDTDLLPTNNYQRLMRGQNKNLNAHFCSVYGDKIQTVINNVPEGKGRAHINKLIETGRLDKKYELTSGYKNTYGRLWHDRPCTTITNNMSTPSGLRCIHYNQNRALTPREGARIQSFPDWFQFYGTKRNIKTQIGNAVPPLLAMKFAEQLEIVLE
jgi:DNA (cytosine-5)-methyltransferase 1